MLKMQIKCLTDIDGWLIMLRVQGRDKKKENYCKIWLKNRNILYEHHNINTDL